MLLLSVKFKQIDFMTPRVFFCICVRSIEKRVLGKMVSCTVSMYNIIRNFTTLFSLSVKRCQNVKLHVFEAFVSFLGKVCLINVSKHIGVRAVCLVKVSKLME